MSLVICVFSFLLLMIPLNAKCALAVLGRIGLFVGLWILPGCVYIILARLLQFMLSSAAWARGSALPFFVFRLFFEEILM